MTIDSPRKFWHCSNIEMKPVKTYEIVDDSGVDYNFLGEDRNKRPWLGQIVKGSDVREKPYRCITVEKPYGLIGTYTSDPESFREIPESG